MFSFSLLFCSVSAFLEHMLLQDLTRMYESISPSLSLIFFFRSWIHHLSLSTHFAVFLAHLGVSPSLVTLIPLLLNILQSIKLDWNLHTLLLHSNWKQQLVLNKLNLQWPIKTVLLALASMFQQHVVKTDNYSYFCDIFPTIYYLTQHVSSSITPLYTKELWFLTRFHSGFLEPWSYLENKPVLPPVLSRNFVTNGGRSTTIDIKWIKRSCQFKST